MLQNWKKLRPISLLNIDLKLISKAFPSTLKTVIPSSVSLKQTVYIEKWFREIPYHIIQASTPPASEFLLLWTQVRFTKVRYKSKISGPGKFRNLLFQSFRIGPSDQKWLPQCRNGDYPMLADINFWEKFSPNNLRNWTWKVLEAEESKNPT